MTDKNKRDIREEMITDEEQGPLYIPAELKEEGYVYRIVDADRPGRVQKLQRMGYELVADLAKIGDNTVKSTSQLSSAATLELGTVKHRQGVVMRIPEDLYAKRQKAKDRRNQEQERALGNTGISTQFGEITIGNKNN